MQDSLAGMDQGGKGLPEGLRSVRANNPGPLTGEGTNSWLLGRGQVALVDPGPALASHKAALLAALEPGESLALILITHPHADHAALAPDLAQQTGARLVKLHAGQVLRGSWGVMQALHTPGHHPAHFCLIGAGWAVTGDHVMGWSSTLVAPPEGRMADYMTSLDRLEAAGQPLGLPGHGPVITDLAARIAALRRHRQSRAAAILAAVQGGAQRLSGITDQVYGPMGTDLAQAARASCLAHLIDLAERNLIRAENPIGTDAIFRPM